VGFERARCDQICGGHFCEQLPEGKRVLAGEWKVLWRNRVFAEGREHCLRFAAALLGAGDEAFD